MNQHQHTVIIITGPTASGKTALAIQLAEHLQTNIISADSRQCFRELNIGVAKPTTEELHRVKHYFINSHSIHDNVTAQTFEQYALASAEEIFKHNKYAVMAGGTGLYIKAFCEGLDIMPPIDGGIRENIMVNYTKFGLPWLQNELKKKDPGYWQSAEQQNPQRLMRALEVFDGTGQSIVTFRKKEYKKRPFNIIKIGINISREKLRANINERVDRMITEGLVNEVKSLLAYKNMNALQTVGYRELIEYFEGKISLSEAINNIKTNTRQYAKRQLTWFRKDKDIMWLTAESISFDNILL